MSQINPRIKQNADFLYRIAKTRGSSAKSKTILANASPEELLCIVEICYNILKGNFFLTKKQLKALNTKTPYIRQISRIRSLKSAQKIIQKGEGVPALVASFFLPILTEYLFKKVTS